MDILAGNSEGHEFESPTLVLEFTSIHPKGLSGIPKSLADSDNHLDFESCFGVRSSISRLPVLVFVKGESIGDWVRCISSVHGFWSLKR